MADIEDLDRGEDGSKYLIKLRDRKTFLPTYIFTYR